MNWVFQSTSRRIASKATRTRHRAQHEALGAEGTSRSTVLKMVTVVAESEARRENAKLAVQKTEHVDFAYLLKLAKDLRSFGKSSAG